ncbi:relaxase/mobilization nuclease domain-containing protein [Arthrobacter bambusae]|uniref:relaxase/mobilization nuclease domain-containing protein n=1 Tax=Arthrobacter bambusae TaxID=1338426 RepID=UPI002783E107|nr:relaxase/mobilization nuclease domain-containing protein [Arthrobacter bambusae]MDQ0241394.1 hypothetical protein [Arthrobacter bambusae]
MMPNVTKGDRMVGLVKYLAGPGRSNEHTEQRVVAASDSVVSVLPGQFLNEENSTTLGHELDLPKAVFGAGSSKHHVFHVSLSLAADEGNLTDEKWSEIAHGFAAKMGFDGSDGKAPCRWVAIHHGSSTAGNDHIHLAVSMVREDGTRWSQHNDFKRAQAACDELEKEHGLRVVRGVHAERGYHPKEAERARAQGAAELDRDRLQREVRAAATASLGEAEFVRRLRRSGVLVRPRFGQGGQERIAGYSVALKPPTKMEKPVWFGGGRLAKDLTLPKLREGWDASPDAVASGLAEWRAVANGERITVDGREAREPTAEEWQKYTADVGELYERLKAAPLDDDRLWAQVARETSGAFAAWSLRTESMPGPLAETAKALARSAQLRRFPPRVEHAPMPSARGAGMLLMQTAVGPSTAAGHALLLAQLRNTMRAIHDMHKEAGRLRDADRIKSAAMDKLTIVRGQLQDLQDQHKAGLPPVAAAPRVPGASLPAKDVHMEEMLRVSHLAFPASSPAAGSVPAPKPGTPDKGTEKDRGLGR